MHGDRCQREFWCNFEVYVSMWPVVVLHIELKWLLFYCKTVLYWWHIRQHISEGRFLHSIEIC